MAANCAQLRQSLAHLQSQLNVLTNKNGKQEEPPKQEKPKKSKSKKNKDKQAQKAAEEVTESEEAVPKEAVENEPSTSEDKAQNEAVEEKVDDKTLENLIQAINSANINLSDLEVVNDENDNENLDEVLEIEVNSAFEQVTPEENTKLKITEILPSSNEGMPKVNEVKAEINEVTNVKVETTPETKKDVAAEVNSNEVKSDLNVSLTEVNSNEEVSHIPEVKPIA